ncbi:MFS transporter [Paenibacillus sinensis]
MLVNGVFIPLTAYLMQRFTTRELFLSAMLAFLAGSILSSVTPGFELLLIGRLVQAAGAGIVMPLLMNVVLRHFSRGETWWSYGNYRGCHHFRSGRRSYLCRVYAGSLYVALAVHCHYSICRTYPGGIKMETLIKPQPMSPV